MRNLTPAVDWFALMKVQDAPENVAPVRIACFAITEDDHVVAMVPDWEGETATLVPVTDDECIAIVHADDARDPNWQDIAKHRLKVELEGEDRERAKDPAQVKTAIDHIRRAGIEQSSIVVLTAMRKQEAYLYDPKVLHPLYEANVIATFEGGYKLSVFGEAVLRALVEKPHAPH